MLYGAWGFRNDRVLLGLDVDTARFLLQAKRNGVSFEKTVSLGRQYFSVGGSELRSLLSESKIEESHKRKLLDQPYPSYADAFWEALGCSHLDTIDASDFEGATNVHDLNTEMPAEWKGRYDAVCDVGTLEHVFHYPTALRNCMELLRVGGTFFAFTTANNYFGHGFYQFSPELFFRVFSEENGFQLNRCIAVEYGARVRWFDVVDPESKQARVTLLNRHPVLLFVEARRVSDKPVLSRAPQQSDYVPQWSDGGEACAKPAMAVPEWKRSLLKWAARPVRVIERLRMNYLEGHRFGNRRSFSRASKRVS